MISAVMRPLLLPLLLLLPACASTVTVAPDASLVDASARNVSDAATPPPPDVVVPRDDLETFVQTGAAAVCEGLFRCCDAPSRAQFRSYYSTDPRLAGLRDAPPFTDAAACRTFFETAFRDGPFSDWLDAARRGLVRYDPDGSVACRRAIAEATCGPSMRAALSDSRCFGPGGGFWFDRRMFPRTATAGSPCRAVRDEPHIGSFHGTCDAASAFCCVPSPTAPERCLSPYESVRTGLVDGRCRTASAEGEPCTSAILNGEGYTACSGSQRCTSVSHRCATDPVTPLLAAGALCYDPQEHLSLGRCREGLRCDGSSDAATNTCVPTLRLGEPCAGSALCESYLCEGGRCAESAFRCLGP